MAKDDLTARSSHPQPPASGRWSSSVLPGEKLPRGAVVLGVLDAQGTWAQLDVTLPAVPAARANDGLELTLSLTEAEIDKRANAATAQQAVTNIVACSGGP